MIYMLINIYVLNMNIKEYLFNKVLNNITFIKNLDIFYYMSEIENIVSFNILLIRLFNFLNE